MHGTASKQRSKASTGDGVRKSLAKKLLKLRVKHAKIFADMDSLKATLIDLVTEDGDGTAREVFLGLGTVTIAPCKAKEFRGELPEVDPTAFGALSDARRQKLLDEGLIRLVPNWSRDFRGSVTLKTFT
jgi:hypothetical protein